MEHEEAARTLAVEKYFLNDMDEAEEEAFEAHLAVCIACQEDAHWCELFIAALRDLLR